MLKANFHTKYPKQHKSTKNINLDHYETLNICTKCMTRFDHDGVDNGGTSATYVPKEYHLCAKGVCPDVRQ